MLICKRLPFFLLLMIGLILSLSAEAPKPGAANVPAALPTALQPQTWMDHMVKDLIPFWITPDALGTPVGNFPTVRTMSGKPASDPKRLPRMLGRQIFFYCVAYLMTGDEKLLSYAKAGTEWLIDHGWDQENGGWFGQLSADGRPYGKRAKYTQDMAYAALGPAAYFFVTRDAKAEEYVKKTHAMMFDPKYFWDVSNERIKDGLDFFMKNEQDQEGGGWELVAILDQINAYMLLVQPVLTAKVDRERWSQDLVTLGKSLVKHFWKDGIFWGQKNNVGRGGRHVDFGHTLKSYWMLYLIDQRLGTKHFSDLVKAEVPGWIKLAFDPDNGLWGSSMRGRTAANYGSSWWIFAECDQIAATMNLRDGTLTPLLEKTAEGWLKYFVDRKWGEVYSDIQRNGTPGAAWDEDSTSKVWDWKNGFHSAEHALILYIHGLVREGKPVPLYFAAENPTSFEALPYTFKGRETSREPRGTFELAGRTLTKLRVEFQLE